MSEQEARVVAFMDAMGRLVGTQVPFDLIPGCRWHPHYSDIFAFALQSWVADHCPEWMSGIGCIEAAEVLVETSIEVDLEGFVQSVRRLGK